MIATVWQCHCMAVLFIVWQCYCVAVSLYCSATVSRCRCIALLLCRGVSASHYHCVAVSLHRTTTVSRCLCIALLLYHRLNGVLPCGLRRYCRVAECAIAVWLRRPCGLCSSYLSQFLSDQRVVDLHPVLWQPILQLIILSRFSCSSHTAVHLIDAAVCHTVYMTEYLIPTLLLYRALRSD